MSIPDYPKDEKNRLLALRNTGILDTEAEERFDRITRLAARIFSVQTCLVSLIDSDRQWFKSKVGLDVCETSRDISFCGHAILQADIFIVPDASKDPRFSSNPLVTSSPHIRFYAGAPVFEPSGHIIGTLCLIEPVARTFSNDEKHMLKDLAAMVSHEIAKLDHERTQRELSLHALRLSSILSTMPDMVFVLDKNHRYLICNEHSDLLKSPEEIIGFSIDEVLPIELADTLKRYIKQAFSTSELIRHEYILSATGESFEARYKKIDDNEVLVVIRNITKEKQDEALIRNSENLLKAVVDANTIGTWRLNLLNDELIINDKWASLLGRELEELMPTDRRTWEHLTHPDDLAYCVTQIEKHAKALIPTYEANIRMRHKNENWVWVNTRGRVTSWTSDGVAEWLVGTHFDINDQIQAESSLDEKSKQMEAIVESMLDGVVSIDEKGNVLTFNQAAEEIFGYRSAEIIGQNVNILMPSPHSERHNGYLSNYLLHGNSDITGRIRELEGLHKNGTLFPIELGITEVKANLGINFIGIIRDITQRKKREQEIHQLAFYDSLTKLPNRRLLQDRLQKAIAHSLRAGKFASLLFLDLDNFKDLNDSAGHDTGDLLLCKVAKRLVDAVRTEDTVARLGGDEFVIVVGDLSTVKQKAVEQTEKLAQKIIASLSKEYDLDGVKYNSSASIGITLFNSDDVSKEELLKQADMAMYNAKDNGRNALQLYDPQMQVNVMSRASLITDLYKALDEHQFDLYYQKQVDQFGKVIGVEALLRWLHPIKGLISPGLFIPLAEETGVIEPLGSWVLNKACQTLTDWSNDARRADITIAVNISVVQFSKRDFVDVVTRALRQSGAQPRLLKLEITESLLASNIPDVKTKMQKLQALGVTFSIDDFGTGYSSLTYLKQLPLNQLKIDQSFVRDIMENSNDKAIAQAVITLAHSMGLDVIAEGVETEDQLMLLKNMGCFTYQGYYFGKPCPLDTLDV